MPETYSSSDKPSQEIFILGDKRLQMSGWDDAIAYAKNRIESLTAAIKIFERHKDTGEPFLGEIPEGENYEQDGK